MSTHPLCGVPEGEFLNEFKFRECLRAEQFVFDISSGREIETKEGKKGRRREGRKEGRKEWGARKPDSKVMKFSFL